MITITRDKVTKDFAVERDGEIIGYRSSMQEAIALKAEEEAKQLKTQ